RHGGQRGQREDRLRHADHHALPAHPAPHRAAVRAHHVRGADRQGGWPGAGGHARGEGLRLDPRGGRGGGLMSLVLPTAAEFPVLAREGLVYLDSAATAQTVRPALEAMDRYYNEYRASIHRGVYPLANEATDAYEAARESIAAFAGSTAGETVFTRNAT